MQIKKLKLNNFQRFKEKELIFSEQFNVLVGENGTGKSAIIKAISIVLSAYINNFSEDEPKEISQSDVRSKEILYDQISTVEPQYPTSINCKISADQFLEYGYQSDGGKLEWSCERHLASGFLITNEGNLTDIALEVQEDVQIGRKTELPVFVSYNTNRLWAINNKKEQTDHFEVKSRFAGYKNFLTPYINENDFIYWFIRMSLAEIKLNKPLPILTSVKTAITNCLEVTGIVGIDYSPLSNEILAIMPDGESIPMRLLSDGFRSIIGLVADIAYRMAILNPFLDNPLQTSGIILIDEIDLHLHPKWQRNIVNDLKSTFPNVQFIVTTHSPFIVQSLSVNELQTLDDNKEEQQISPEKFVNKSLEDVATNVMGIVHPQRNEKLQRLYKLTKEYYLLIKKGLNPSDDTPKLQEDIKSIKCEIDKLSSLFSDNIAYHAILEIEREELERKGKKK